jgi:L-alanine-DL-glutamate epimerase-like enolase superfamily enzyme
MKITDVDLIQIYPKNQSRNRNNYAFYGQLSQITVYRVTTDSGLVGYGETRGPMPPRSSVDAVIGRAPFDYIDSNLNHGLVAALYDVMGKYLEVPAYKLMGQKRRDAVSLAAWTRPCSPAEFAEEVTHAAAAGYTILKMHTSPLWDVLEHVRQVEAVAPQGFRLHFDFNGGTVDSRSPRTVATVLPLVRELEGHPVVGFIEDALARYDVHGWRTLRERTRIPLILGHGGMLGTALDATLGMADLYMLGGGGIGQTLARGQALGLLNTQVMFQLVGNALSAALAMHMAAVLPTATGHCITQMEQYEEDIVRTPIAVQEGFAPVPEAPGLGLEVDDDALSRLAANPDPYASIPRGIGILRLPYGKTLYTRSFPNVGRQTGTEEGAIRGIDFELWQDDGSERFEQLYARLEKDGSFLAEGAD